MKEDSVYISHILDAISDIKELTHGMHEKDFLGDKAVKLAVVKSFEIIGEASKNLSDGFRNANPRIPWSDIAKMRDKTVHFYFGINYSIVWETLRNDLPKLEKEIISAQKSCLSAGESGKGKGN